MKRLGSEFLLVVLFGVLSFVTGYFILPSSRVASVEVIGTETLTPEVVVHYSGYKPHQVLLMALWNQEDASAKLKRIYPQIESISVNVVDGNHLQLQVKEYPIVAYIQDAEGTYLPVLSNGTILKESALSLYGSVPIIKGFTSEEQQTTFLKQFGQVAPEVRNAIAEIVYMNQADKPFLTTLYMQDGNRVLLHYDVFAEKLNYYRGMLKEIGEKRGVVDLTIGAFFTPYENE